MTLSTAMAAFAVNFIGGLFPDIDQPTSDFWDNFRLGPVVAKFFCPAIGGHRHISHSLLGLLLIGYGTEFLTQKLSSVIFIDMKVVWAAFMIGVISHLVLDLFTKEGLPLLWPLEVKIGIPPFKWMRMTAGTWMEHILAFPVLLASTLYLLYMHQEKVLMFLQQYLK
jgi:inner membrane protein